MALAFAACGDDDDDSSFNPTFAYLSVDGEVNATLGDGDEERSFALPDDVEPLNSLSCNASGVLAIPVGRNDTLLPPLILSDGEFALARELPAAVDPTWIDSETLLVRVADPESGVGTRVYELRDERFSPLTESLPGQGPTWLADLEMIAIRAGPGGGFDRLGIYGLSFDQAQSGPVGAEEWDLLASIPIEPRQLSPDGATFAFATAAQENQQRDIQAIDADGMNPRTIIATPLEEYAPTWTPDGDLLFLRRELLDPGQDETEANVEVVEFDPESSEERILAEGAGITTVAACSSGE